jgi:hypothetical protein
LDRQEFLDRFYFSHGPCCAGCDWWRSMTSRAGDCTKSRPVSGKERWAMLGIEKCSLGSLPVGHIVTPHNHVCGGFKDGFDWSSLPLSYQKRIGAPIPAPGQAVLPR